MESGHSSKPPECSRRNVPAAGVTASATLMLIGVALNYIVPEQVFVYVTSISLVGSLWARALIVIAHLGYRKAIAIGAARPVAYRMPRLAIYELVRGRVPRPGRDSP